MNKQINPTVGIVIAVIVAIGIGLVSWKMFAKPAGVYGKIPASASNPNGGGPSMPSDAPRN